MAFFPLMALKKRHELFPTPNILITILFACKKCEKKVNLVHSSVVSIAEQSVNINKKKFIKKN